MKSFLFVCSRLYVKIPRLLQTAGKTYFCVVQKSVFCNAQKKAFFRPLMQFVFQETDRLLFRRTDGRFYGTVRFLLEFSLIFPRRILCFCRRLRLFTAFTKKITKNLNRFSAARNSLCMRLPVTPLLFFRKSVLSLPGGRTMRRRALK